jgi:hypothetical protein
MDGEGVVWRTPTPTPLPVLQLRTKDACDHEWEFYEDEAARPYTGYLERCEKCGTIVQIPQ